MIEQLPKLSRAVAETVKADDIYQIRWKYLDQFLVQEYARLLTNHLSIRPRKVFANRLRLIVRKTERQKEHAHRWCMRPSRRARFQSPQDVPAMQRARRVLSPARPPHRLFQAARGGMALRRLPCQGA